MQDRRTFRPGKAFPANEGHLGHGFVAAFGNRNDYHHEWAVGIAERVTEPLLTCEACLAETAFHLGSSALVLAFLRDGLARSALVMAEHVARLAELAARYADAFTAAAGAR